MMNKKVRSYTYLPEPVRFRRISGNPDVAAEAARPSGFTAVKFDPAGPIPSAAA